MMNSWSGVCSSSDAAPSLSIQDRTYQRPIRRAIAPTEADSSVGKGKDSLEVHRDIETIGCLTTVAWIRLADRR